MKRHVATHFKNHVLTLFGGVIVVWRPDQVEKFLEGPEAAEDAEEDAEATTAPVNTSDGGGGFGSVGLSQVWCLVVCLHAQAGVVQSQQDIWTTQGHHL